jgi:hypothetical protein
LKWACLDRSVGAEAAAELGAIELGTVELDPVELGVAELGVAELDPVELGPCWQESASLSSCDRDLWQWAGWCSMRDLSRGVFG